VDYELIKDIVGRPRWWLIAVPLMVVFLVVASLLLPDDAESAVKPTSARTCPSSEWSCYTADRYAEEFRDGRFRTSQGIEFTPRIKRMISHAMSSKGYTARGDDDWWRGALSFTTCIGGARWRGACRRGQEFVGELMAETTRITVFCGGLAVIGSLAGGGAWGAGRATAACLWTRLMGVWQ